MISDRISFVLITQNHRVAASVVFTIILTSFGNYVTKKFLFSDPRTEPYIGYKAASAKTFPHSQSLSFRFTFRFLSISFFDLKFEVYSFNSFSFLPFDPIFMPPRASNQILGLGICRFQKQKKFDLKRFRLIRV